MTEQQHLADYADAADMAVCGHVLSREAGDDVVMAAAFVLDILTKPWPSERFTTFKGLSLEAAARIVAERVLAHRAPTHGG